MPETQTGVRMALAAEGSANVTTGLPVLDHLIGELARARPLPLSLEVAPGRADEAVASAGARSAAALGDLLAMPGANGAGWALCRPPRHSPPHRSSATPSRASSRTSSSRTSASAGSPTTSRRVFLASRPTPLRSTCMSACSRAPTRSTC